MTLLVKSVVSRDKMFSTSKHAIPDRHNIIKTKTQSGMNTEVIFLLHKLMIVWTSKISQNNVGDILLVKHSCQVMLFNLVFKWCCQKCSLTCREQNEWTWVFLLINHIARSLVLCKSQKLWSKVVTFQCIEESHLLSKEAFFFLKPNQSGLWNLLCVPSILKFGRCTDTIAGMFIEVIASPLLPFIQLTIIFLFERRIVFRSWLVFIINFQYLIPNKDNILDSVVGHKNCCINILLDTRALNFSYNNFVYSWWQQVLLMLMVSWIIVCLFKFVWTESL